MWVVREGVALFALVLREEAARKIVVLSGRRYKNEQKSMQLATDYPTHRDLSHPVLRRWPSQ